MSFTTFPDTLIVSPDLRGAVNKILNNTPLTWDYFTDSDSWYIANGSDPVKIDPTDLKSVVEREVIFLKNS